MPFLGFPPRKSGQRRKLFESLRTLPFTLVFYESPLRAAATLADLAEMLGAERPACLARELTKPYEEFVRSRWESWPPATPRIGRFGEVTLVVGGAGEDAAAEPLSEAEIAEEARVLLAQGRSARDAADELSARTGRPRREIYRLVTQAK